MNPPSTVESLSDPFDSLKVMKESVMAFNQMMLKTSEDLQKIQSASGTSTILDGLMGMAPFLSGVGTQNLVWQFPTLYQTQAERLLKSMLDFGGVLLHTQQGLYELAAQSMSRSVQQTVKAMTKVNETVASRRVSAEVIDFADRREKAHAAQNPTEVASDVQTGSHPMARKTTR